MTTSSSNIDVFVIPNHHHSFDHYEEETFKEINEHAVARLNRKCDSLELAIDGERVHFEMSDIPVEIWTTGLGSDNWQDHGMPESIAADDEFEKVSLYFISYLPYRLIKDKKESDIITVSVRGREFLMHCNQRSYRYRQFGNFEDVMNNVVE